MLTGETRVASNYLGGPVGLEDRIWDRILTDIFGRTVVRAREDWDHTLREGGAELHRSAETTFHKMTLVLDELSRSRGELSDLAKKCHRPDFVRDRLADLDELAEIDHVFRLTTDEWSALPRWIRAVVSRARKGVEDPGKEERASDVWYPLVDRWKDAAETVSPLSGWEKRNALREAWIMVQELRVSLFAAGDVRPAGKISASRVETRLEEIERMV
jgi:hypothetical protein